MNTCSLEEICATVKRLVLESLDVEDGDYSLRSNLVDDLRAESLDFLDIVFRLEKQYGVKIERGKVQRLLRERFPDASLKPNAPVNDAMRAVLRELLPEVPAPRIEKVTKLKEISSVFTIGSFVRLTVEALRESKSVTTTSSGSIDEYGPEQLGALTAPPPT